MWVLELDLCFSRWICVCLGDFCLFCTMGKSTHENKPIILGRMLYFLFLQIQDPQNDEKNWRGWMDGGCICMRRLLMLMCCLRWIFFFGWGLLFLFKRRFFLDTKNWIQWFLVQMLLSLFSQIWKQHSLRIQAISKPLPKICRIDGRNIPSTE